MAAAWQQQRRQQHGSINKLAAIWLAKNGEKPRKYR
jgi:hypothetical protein